MNIVLQGAILSLAPTVYRDKNVMKMEYMLLFIANVLTVGSVTPEVTDCIVICGVESVLSGARVWRLQFVL